MGSMFAKVFGQIFDSSIAENYNCRRMFMDLLILADSDGDVDMTVEAIARRTNVPISEVTRYIAELQEPDPTSRSKVSDGRRLVPLDSARDWGWRIVNYGHYRRIKDEEARRSYFRDAQRRYRARQKAVKDVMLTEDNATRQMLTPASASASSSALGKRDLKGEGKARPINEKAVIDYCLSLSLVSADGEYFWSKWEGSGYRNGPRAIRDWRATIRSWKAAGHCPSQKRGRTLLPQSPVQAERESKRDREMREAQELYDKETTNRDHN